jgi:hypothetical protein
MFSTYNLSTRIKEGKFLDFSLFFYSPLKDFCLIEDTKIATVSTTPDSEKSVLIISDIESGITLHEFEVNMKVEQMVWSQTYQSLIIKSKENDTFSIDFTGKTTKLFDCLFLAKNDLESFSINGQFNTELGYFEEIKIENI